jgi:hypothetical protein
MDERARFRETMLFGKPDKVPLDPGGPRESTLKAWHQQGLPEGVDWKTYLWQILGIPQEPERPRLDLGVSFKMLPTFEEKVLEHRDGHYVVQDWMGAIVEISDEYNYTYLREPKDFVTRKWHRFPVQTRQDWEDKLKWRYDPRNPERFPSDFAERCRALRDHEHVLRLDIPGPFWQLREWCGFEPLCLLMIEQPDFAQEMAEFWMDFIMQTLEPILARVELDQVQINEDMAYKLHAMISPKMIRRFVMPAWKKWIAALKAGGCAVVTVDSDGYIGELLPLWIEAGFDGTWPVEVAAGNDIAAFRNKYGQQIAYGGGIDKRALAAEGEMMRAEVMRVAPVIQDGGYIPGCDHGVPADVSWPNFVEYTRLLAQLTGWL